MKNSIERKELKDTVNAYILNCIDGESYGRTFADNKEKVNFLMETFEKEYIHNNNRKENPVNLFASWCQGLPSSFNLAFENYRILEIAREWKTLSTTAAHYQEDKILGNWWNYIANKFFQLHKALNRG